jgi:hypothetical protein
MPLDSKPKSAQPNLEQRVNNIESRLKWLLGGSGVTLVGLLELQ